MYTYTYSELGDAMRSASIAVTDSIQGATVYGSVLQHAYLVAKYHEIAACGAVIAGLSLRAW